MSMPSSVVVTPLSADNTEKTSVPYLENAGGLAEDFSSIAE